MGEIVFVVPCGEIDFRGVYVRHTIQNSIGFQKGSQQSKLPFRIMKMLDYFTANNVVVLLLKQFRFVFKKGIVLPDRITGFFKN